MFSVHNTPDKSENATITDHFGFVFLENSGRDSHDYCDVIVFEKLPIQNVSIHTKTESRRFQIHPLRKAFSKGSVSVTMGHMTSHKSLVLTHVLRRLGYSAFSFCSFYPLVFVVFLIHLGFIQLFCVVWTSHKQP